MCAKDSKFESACCVPADVVRRGDGVSSLGGADERNLQLAALV